MNVRKKNSYCWTHAPILLRPWCYISHVLSCLLTYLCSCILQRNKRRMSNTLVQEMMFENEVDIVECFAWMSVENEERLHNWYTAL